MDIEFSSGVNVVTVAPAKAYTGPVWSEFDREQWDQACVEACVKGRASRRKAAEHTCLTGISWFSTLTGT